MESHVHATREQLEVVLAERVRLHVQAHTERMLTVSDRYEDP